MSDFCSICRTLVCDVRSVWYPSRARLASVRRREKVNPFDAHVPVASFDPLNNGAAGAGAAAGGGYANGGGNGGGGGWAGGAGDSAGVLQLGMQFEVRTGKRDTQRERERATVRDGDNDEAL